MREFFHFSITQIISLTALLLLPLITAVYEQAVFVRHLPSTGLSLPNLGKLFVKFLRGLMNSLHWQEQRKIWGTVYDSVTKEPIDPVLVELLYADTGKKVEEAITDLAGRYGFLAYPGRYKIRPLRNHYQFPSSTMAGQSDQVYDDLYHGEVIEVTEGLDVIAPNIPMDPIAQDFNQAAKRAFFSLSLQSRKILNIVFRIIFWTGLAVAMWNFFASFSFFDSGILIIYFSLLLIAVRPATKRLWGRVIDSKTNQPVPGLLLELRVPRINVLIGKAKTGVAGRFFLKCNPGKYELSLSKIYVGRAGPVITSMGENGRGGALDKK